jgi:hypothetical protein
VTASAEIVVVSGLPRSGTSLMMQMLAAGGIALLTDLQRTADADNPRGYFELEAVKRLRQDAAWLTAARGKAIKVVSQLLRDLPASERYAVLLMQRDLDEVLDSQAAMIARQGRTGGARATLRAAFENHLVQTAAWLAAQPHLRSVTVDYAAVVADPTGQAALINAFLGGALDESEMAAAVDPALYRNRRI